MIYIQSLKQSRLSNCKIVYRLRYSQPTRIIKIFLQISFNGILQFQPRDNKYLPPKPCGLVVEAPHSPEMVLCWLRVYSILQHKNESKRREDVWSKRWKIWTQQHTLRVLQLDGKPLKTEKTGKKGKSRLTLRGGYRQNQPAYTFDYAKPHPHNMGFTLGETLPDKMLLLR